MRVDAIFRNGNFVTFDKNLPRASTLAVFAGRIVALGDDVSGLTADEEHDLGGATVVPGLHDAHHHLTGRGKALNALDLSEPQIDSLDALYAAVGGWVDSHPDLDFVYARGYDQFTFGGQHPSADALDTVTDGRPTWLEHVSGHMGVANTAAFSRAGFPGREAVPDVDGGSVARDDRGRATGLLQEKAKDLLRPVIKLLPIEDIVQNIETGARKALSEGLTMITEPGLAGVDGIGHSELDFGAYQRALASDRLGIRAVLMPYLTALHRYEAANEGLNGLDLGLYTGFGGDWLRLGPVKVLTDGSLLGRSAAMKCRYEGHDHAGFLLWDHDELEELTEGAYRSGFSLAAHAIGDEAIDKTLDLIEQLQRKFPRKKPRNRIEHFGVSTLAQVERTAQLGVVPVPQARFISELGDNMMEALGMERSKGCYRMKSHLQMGTVLPGSSDAPVSHGNPLWGIHDMVNRRTARGVELAPEEALTAHEAFYAYSAGSAYAAGIEDDVGTLSRGKYADFAILSDDPFHINPSRLNTLTVGATIVGGQVRYSDGAL